MTNEDFMDVVAANHEGRTSLLLKKEKQYSAGKDRLDQFKRAAQLTGYTSVGALAGMMIKHTTKLYQMIVEHELEKTFSQEEWYEVIYDHMNYHDLLIGCLIDEGAI